MLRSTLTGQVLLPYTRQILAQTVYRDTLMVPQHMAIPEQVTK